MPDRLVHFLLIEDDDGHAELVQRSLHKERVQNTLDRVKDGAAAISYLRNEPPYEDAHRPDVVLLDLKLPKVDGHEVLRIIKADPAMQSIPVVVLTTSDAEADREQAYALNANSYLVKPIDFDQFRRIVKDLSLYWGVWNRGSPAPRD
jgi:CheY-like chemotaxis protein